MSRAHSLANLRRRCRCHRCHSHKIKCSGEKPCRSCVAANHDCQFPARERRVVVSESYLAKLQADSKRLQETSQHPTPVSVSQHPTPTESSPREDERDNDGDDDPPLSSEESNMLNPLFDGRPEYSGHQRAQEPGFIGEASCAAFSNRLLQCLDDTYTPSTAGFPNYHRMELDRIHFSTSSDNVFPERMHAKLLLNVARRFIGNYHPLFLEVTYMREIDAVYRREMIPSTVWLCKFYALMALGEIYASRRGIGPDNTIPGTEYYSRAVNLLPECLEEPCLMQVEALISIAWASNVLGRVRTAYCYSGTAMRLAMSMGMHRSASGLTRLTPVERESRRRTWWVLYFFDRFSASKLGQPVSVRDENIDVEMPSMDGLTEEETAEFLDPVPLVKNIHLARIIGNILTDIYGIPKAKKGPCIHRVHGVLKQLRAWHDSLPPDMRVRDRGTPRPHASLHLAYNQCIIQTTRPILLHLFKSQFQLGAKARSETSRQSFSSVTLALAESCINAAQASSRIVEGLFLDGSIATFGYWDAHHIFSASLILVMSAVMKPTTANSDALETLLSILRTMKNDGNIPAVDYCDRLAHLQSRICSLRVQGRIAHLLSDNSASANHGESTGSEPHDRNVGDGGSRNIASRTAQEGTIIHYDKVDILGNPLLGSFLDDHSGPIPDLSFMEDGTLRQLASEIEEQFLFSV
ncbi:fungal-specific transcription factor domain-containing protein [Stachybotrys elegans]|uniref:Fungal-specific transcription factor domain-containing protein n=1 Tax=Stachybotrys elegans TaxID=80388 RepID=A0A8K0SPB7_9HYPO|nr:fungal-specific transcription factor domain-containing protein [Stachybotrys elegans]